MSEQKIEQLEQLEQREAIFNGTIKMVAVAGEDNEIYVPLKQFCDEIGINWEAQRRRTANHYAYDPARKMVRVKGERGSRHQLCLPVGLIGSWMLDINPNDLKDRGAAEVLAIFQKEVHERIEQVFWDYFAIDKDKVMAASMGVLDDRQKILEMRQAWSNSDIARLEKLINVLIDDLGSVALDVEEIKKHLGMN